jgi:DNA-binding transcriptional MerR regulator
MLGEDQTPTDADLERARRIRRLRRDLGLSYESIDIVLRLVDRLEAAEADRAPEAPAAVRIRVIGR